MFWKTLHYMILNSNWKKLIILVSLYLLKKAKRIMNNSNLCNDSTITKIPYSYYAANKSIIDFYYWCDYLDFKYCKSTLIQPFDYLLYFSFIFCLVGCQFDYFKVCSLIVYYYWVVKHCFLHFFIMDFVKESIYLRLNLFICYLNLIFVYCL